MYKIENKKFYKEITLLALPIAGQYLISQILQLLDNVMVGTLGEECISAVAISGTLAWLIMTFFMGFASGASVLSAQEYGRKNLGQMRTLAATTIRINLMVSLIFFLLATFFPASLMSLYTNQTGIIEQGVTYVSIIKYSIPLYGISSALVSMLQSGKNVKIGLINTMVSTLVNAGLNYILIFGKFGFPVLGLKGAAIATLIARFCEFCIVMVYVLCIEKEIQFRLFDLKNRLTLDVFKTLMKVSLPILAIEVLGNLVSSVQTSITGHISAFYIAANSIVHTAWVIPSTLSFGISIAAGVMIGNVIGEGNKEKVYAYGNRFVSFGYVFGVFNSIVLTLILPVIMSYYHVSSDTLDLASKMGRLAIVTVFFISTSSIVCNGVIKASGQTQTLLKIDILSNWAIAIPLGYICAFILKVPVHYLYLILRSGNIFKSIWGIHKVKGNHWLNELKKVE
ncbi:MAG: MATE family efflux transporter [Firmicutes bacterium]|nr:MATE family efflux transporter [Bacillota bacterium]